MTIFDYLNKFEFDYIQTYSFNRGEKLIDSLSETDKEALRLSKQIINAPSELKSKLVERFDRITKFKSLERLTDGHNRKSPTATLISEFEKHDRKVAQLVDILSTKIEDIPAWMCAPVFRDAIVFYNKSDKMVSVLNICFECEYIQDEQGNYVDVDVTVYIKLKQMLMDWGHPIETEE